MSNQTAHVEEWLKGKSREDFAIIEHCGRLFWPIKINKLRANGKFEQEPALLCVLDVAELMEAKRDARRVFEEQGFTRSDETLDIWSELEVFAQVAIALREPKPSADGIPSAKYSLETLLECAKTGIPRREVMNLYRQLDAVAKLEDPCLDKLDVETIVRAAIAIADKGNLGPLVAIAGSEVDTCVIGMASLLTGYLTHEHLSPSPEKSTKVRSPSKKSSGSSVAKPTSSPDNSLPDVIVSNDPGV
jgi:hypothetical protein